jgi:TRAP transporter 4TM/12TM fusion protein
MMKRAGYKPEYAAAVEAASSTGGQILPPIMGSAAFLMIEFTGMSYHQIVQAAILPAVLWFTAQFFAVHYESKKLGIMGLPKEKLPNFWYLLITRGYMLLPIIAILVILMMGMSVMKAAMYGIYTALAMNIVAMIIAKILGKQDIIEDKLTPKVFLEILVDAAKTALPVIAACAAAGIIGGVITLTGLGLKLTGAILELANNQLILTMVFTMIASIVLGMGLPTTANYVITATVAAPALLAFDNVPILAAHMFVFYFGIVADITPPVALAAYAGAGLARANPFITSLNSVKIAIGGFIIPYIMVLSPVLILENLSFISLAIVLSTAIIGMYCISTALAGFINRMLLLWERIALIIAGISFIHPDTTANLLGILLFSIVMINQKLIKKRKV